MKKYIRVLVVLLCYVIIAPVNVFAQSDTITIRKKERNIAFRYFSANLFETRARWNYKAASLEAIHSSGLDLGTGSPRQIAELFLQQHSLMLGLTEKDVTLVLERTNKSSGGGIRFLYQQYYKDLPVLGGGYLIAVNRKLYGTEVSATPDGVSASIGQKMYVSDESPDYLEVRNDWYIYFVKGTMAPDILVDVEPEISDLSASSAGVRSIGHVVSNSVKSQLAIHFDRKNVDQQTLA